MIKWLSSRHLIIYRHNRARASFRLPTDRICDVIKNYLPGGTHNSKVWIFFKHYLFSTVCSIFFHFSLFQIFYNDSKIGFYNDNNEQECTK